MSDPFAKQAPNFSALSTFYGGPARIPNESLFEFLTRADIRATLVERLGAPEDLMKMDLSQEIRRRSKADLFWLSRFMLWETMSEGFDKPLEENGITEETHRQMCEFFVKKDDAKPVRDQDTDFKNRILLYPRGSLKSTIDVCDAVQWILNFPDIRILFLTAADDLAQGFVNEARGHFFIHRDPTLMNIFFPDYCIDPDSKFDVGDAFSFNCPIWAKKNLTRKEKTLTASSIVSTLSGFHYEVIKADDAVSNKNSENEEQCARVTHNFNINRKMLRPWGYCDKIGTRYHEADMYGTDIELNIGEVLTSRHGPNVELIENSTSRTKFLIGKAMLIKPERQQELTDEGKQINYRDAGEKGVYLLLPRLLSYSFLMTEWHNDPFAAESQYNQNASTATTAVFDRALLVKNTVEFNKMPFRGPISQTWDFAFKDTKNRDYSTGSSVVWDEKGCFYVQDIVRGRYNHTMLAKTVVEFALKHRPYIVGIEDAGGSKFLEPTIMAEAAKTGDPYIIALFQRIDWYKPENSKDAKRVRMAALHPWLTSGLMKFASYIPILDTVYTEFEKCLLTHKHDDIPDVLSQQPRYAPRMMQIADSENLPTWSKEEAAWNLLYEENCDAYGHPGMGTPIPLLDLTAPPVDEFARAESPDGMDPILGSGIYG